MGLNCDIEVSDLDHDRVVLALPLTTRRLVLLYLTHEERDLKPQLLNFRDLDLVLVDLDREIGDLDVELVDLEKVA